MKRNFTNENFEDFLRQSADGLRMRPSNKVWQNISDHLNQKRRKVGFAIGGFLLALSTIAYFVIEGSTKNSNSFHTTKTSGQSSSTLLKQDATQKISNSIVSRPLLSNSTSFTKENRIMAIPKSTESPALGGLGINELYRLPTFNQFTPTNEFASTIIDSWFESVNNEGVQAQAPASEEAVTYPLTIESVVNSYKPKLHKKKIGLQFYFTPTVSYRKLSENKSFLHTQPLGNPVNMSALIYDVNSMVTHKPNIGFEIGMAAKYPITRNMKLKAGIQFNVSRYDIKAYNAVASYTTLRFNGRSSNGTDTMNTFTKWSNVPGYKVNWLENYYAQISAPVGVELQITGNDKVQFGVATTIQPTYVLGDRAYLISTDYKRYADAPQLVRRWNVNTAFETFVGYSTGRLNWQVGPQVRYQLLSSFITQYPVKENLFDFGLKVGVSMNK